VVNEVEAETVRWLFAGYLSHGSTRALAIWARSAGITTKVRKREDGSIRSGGRPFSRGNLHALLNYRAYIGEVTHKGNTYPGEQAAIVPRDMWDEVQMRLNGGTTSVGAANASGDASLLTGLLYDDTGDRLTPSHANKQGRRYRYYVSRRLIEERSDDPTGWRLPALEIERVIVSALTGLLRNPSELIVMIDDRNLAATTLNQSLSTARQLADKIQQSSAHERRSLIAPIIARITLASGTVNLRINRLALLQAIGVMNSGAMHDDPTSRHHEIAIPFSLRRRGVEARLIVGDQSQAKAVDHILVATIAKAHVWFHELASGGKASVNDIAREQGLAASEISRLLPLAFLAPDIVEAIMAGQQPVELTTKRLKRFDRLPMDWQQQRQVLGFPSAALR
jgi:site-specific DNA recombinase